MYFLNIVMLYYVIYVQKRDLANPMLFVLQFVSNKISINLFWVESYHNTPIYFINKMYELFFNKSYMPTVGFAKVPNRASIFNAC